jgi:hypothetical protein
MEIEKAIEVLKGLIANFKMQREDRLSNLVFGRLSRVIEALELAIQALEKQIPKKANQIKYETGNIDYRCPACESGRVGYYSFDVSL